MSVTEQIDTTLAALLPSATAQQDAYFAEHGVYYQMLWTHTAPPAEPTAPDNLSGLPVGQIPAPVLGLPATMRSRMRIDTYGKPDGWTMTLQAEIDGEVWQRSIDCGTDASRNAAWAVPPPSPE